MDNIESLYNRIKLYSELREKHMQTREGWFQSLLVAASGLLAALVALTNNNQERIEVRFLFVLTVGLLLLGILAAAIALFYNTVCANRARKEAHSYITHKIDSIDARLYLSFSDPKKLLSFGIASYILFSLSFISLMVYVIAKNLPEIF